MLFSPLSSDGQAPGFVVEWIASQENEIPPRPIGDGRPNLVVPPSVRVRRVTVSSVNGPLSHGVSHEERASEDHQLFKKPASRVLTSSGSSLTSDSHTTRHSRPTSAYASTSSRS